MENYVIISKLIRETIVHHINLVSIFPLVFSEHFGDLRS